MKLLIKLLSLLGGAALLIGTAHVTVTYVGGYTDPYAVLVLAIAAGVGMGSIVVGHAWGEGRRALSCWLIFAMLAGELFGLCQTGNRITAALDAKQAPARLALAKRRKAEARLDAALSAVANQPATSPELEAALKDKAAKDQAVLAKADGKQCVANCRLMLAHQVDAAAAAVSAARDRIAAAAVKANGEVDEARAALDALPADVSGAPFADRIGIAPWVFDIITAVLGSIGANGLAAGLLAFGSHRSPTPSKRLTPIAAGELLPAPSRRKRSTRSTALVVAPSPRQQAAQFGVSCFRPDPDAELPIVRIPGRYKLWCEEKGYAPLPSDTIANELRGLFDKAGLLIEQRGKDLVVCGLALAE